MIHTDGIPTIAWSDGPSTPVQPASSDEDAIHRMILARQGADAARVISPSPVRPPCRIRGRDWAGRSQLCVREDRHSGSHVGSTGGRLRAER